MTREAALVISSGKACVGTALLCLLALAASPQVPRFRSEVEAVLVDVSVRDGGRRVIGLTAEDFELRDNGVRQEFSLLSSDSTPLDVILLLDRSSSVHGVKLQALREAVRQFLAGLGDEDRAALITFHHFVDVHSELTTEREPIYQALDRTRALGGTALFDALRRGAILSRSIHNRAILLIFTDGEDTLSGTTEEEVREVVKQSNAVLYAVATTTSLEEEAARRAPLVVTPFTITTKTLDDLEWRAELEARIQERTRFVREIADWTGGRVFDVENHEEIESAFRAILDELEGRYLLAFQPQAVPDDGWHRLEVSLREGPGEVRARRGYFRGGQGLH